MEVLRKIVACSQTKNMLKFTRKLDFYDITESTLTIFILDFRVCYNMCTQKSPFNWSEQLYHRHGETISGYLTRSVLPALKERHDEILLSEFVKRGANHAVMNKWHKKFFMYLVSALLEIPGGF